MKDPIYTPKRKLRVACIGAGASGIYVAYKLQRHFDDFELTVYEKNAGLSGTWWENRYPGCACDVPAHIYTYSFEPKPDWSSTYASAQEICGYFTDFAKKHNLLRYIKLRHAVVGASWDDAAAQWTVVVEDLANGARFRRVCDVLINAGGILNKWKWPEIDGLHSFGGTLVHSAAWDESVDLTAKRVGVIGNGSTGVQLIPAVVPVASSLTSFIRGPSWLSGPFATPQHRYTDAEIAGFRAQPQKLRELRRELESGMNRQFGIFFRGSEFNNMFRQIAEQGMCDKIGDNEELAERLIPKWPIGCRRVTPGLDYLEALKSPKVKTVIQDIKRVQREGVVTADGQLHALDVLICATGFDNSFQPRFKITGKDGKTLNDLWKDEPRSYCGIAAPSMPNYFMTLGPNCPIGNGPVISAIEAQIEYIVEFLAKFQKENLKSFTPHDRAIDEFIAYKDEYMKSMVWTDACRSWYKNGTADGKVTALWPGSTLHYIEALRVPRYEDWIIERRDANRWAFLGNGHSTAEARTGDLSYYIRDEDDSPIDPCLKKSTGTGAATEEKAPQAKI